MDDRDQQHLDELFSPLFERLRGLSDVDAEGIDGEPGAQLAIDRALKIPHRHARGAANAAAPSLEGTKLGQYELGERLGAGGMGVVYRARHVHLATNVAVKVLPDRRAIDPNAVARFKREMRLQANLDHPNVVSAIDGGVEDGQYYVVMKHVEGVDVSKAVSLLGPFSEGAACEVIRQAAEGLSNLHQHELVHRDLKPSNMIIGFDGVVRLIDFGLARVVGLYEDDVLTQTDQVLGTVSYMAPEQFSGAEQVTCQSDIYSLGAVLHYLLTGVAPPRFSATDLSGKTEPGKFSANVQQVLDQFIAADPTLRYPSAVVAKLAVAELADAAALAEVVDILKSGSTSELSPSVAPESTTRLGEVGGPTTEARSTKDEKDTNIAKASEQPLRLNHYVKKILITQSVIVAITLVALLSLGYFLIGSGWYQEAVTSKPSTRTTGKSNQSDQHALSTSERARSADNHEAVALQPASNERRVANMLLERGSELLLYPTKRVSSVDELPTGDFIVLNIVADMAQITDDDCSEIGSLSAVKSLHMFDNPLTGEGLRHFAGFKSLQWLYLGSCRIEDDGVRYLLPHGGQLKSLDLSDTKITTQGLTTLAGFGVLRELLVADNDISDAGLIGLERFPSLLRLNLAGTSITDNGLRHLKTCPTLRYLVLDRTQITDDGIPAISRLENLETISLRETAISEAGFTRLQEALPKCQITH